jgi:hypothetical protein
MPRGLRLATAPSESARGRYQLFEPWHEFEQVRLVAFQPGVDEMSFTPFMCVAAFVVVVL